MNKKELIEKAKAGRVDFEGNISVCSIWNGTEMVFYCAIYADKDGIHACPEGSEEFINDFDPIGFDEIADETYDLLSYDISD